MRKYTEHWDGILGFYDVTIKSPQERQLACDCLVLAIGLDLPSDGATYSLEKWEDLKWTDAAAFQKVSGAVNAALLVEELRITALRAEAVVKAGPFTEYARQFQVELSRAYSLLSHDAAKLLAEASCNPLIRK